MHLDQSLAVTSTYATPESFDTLSKNLDRAWVEEALLSTGVATLRQRRLPMDQVVWLVLGMGLMRSLPTRDIVHKLGLALPTATCRTVAPSAIPAARARLGAEPMQWLFMRTAAEWATPSAERDQWRGLSLWAVDGTSLRVPDTEDNRRHFGAQPKGERGRGDAAYPMVRLAVLMALRSHILAAASFGPYLVDERRYADDLWEALPDRSLVIVDRNYVNANVMALADEARERHWLMRAKSNTKYETLEELGKGDYLVERQVQHYLRRDHPHLPRTQRVRAIEYTVKGEARVLLTSLIDAKRYPASEIIKLYSERWEIELGYDEIKTKLLERHETIRSKSPEAIAQELWGILTAYNLVRLEMERMADELDVSPLQISFIEALREIREQWLWATYTETPGAIPKRLVSMRDRMRLYVLPSRRQRSYRREVKLKMSSYPRKRSSSTGMTVK